MLGAPCTDATRSEARVRGAWPCVSVPRPPTALPLRDSSLPAGASVDGSPGRDRQDVLVSVPAAACPVASGPVGGKSCPAFTASSVTLAWPPCRGVCDLGSFRVCHVSARATTPGDDRRSHRSKTTEAEQNSRNLDVLRAGCGPRPHCVKIQSKKSA